MSVTISLVIERFPLNVQMTMTICGLKFPGERHPHFLNASIGPQMTKFLTNYSSISPTPSIKLLLLILTELILSQESLKAFNPNIFP